MDGTGLQEIEDQGVAKAIRDKVNAFNATAAVVVALLTAAYCALPLSN